MATQTAPHPAADNGATQLSGTGRTVFGGILLLVFLAPLKFGNPVVTQSVQYPPRTVEEWLGSPWSSHPWLDCWFACAVFALLALSLWDSTPPLRMCSGNWKRTQPGVVGGSGLLVFGLLQLAAMHRSINPGLSLDTASAMLAYCTLAFLVARYACSERRIVAVMTAISLGVFAVCWYGFVQRFYSLQLVPSWEEIYRVVGSGPEAARVAQKYHDKRVFSTFVYPNTLGGFLVVAFPAVFAVLWWWRARFTRAAFVALLFVAGAVGAAVLMFTKSNGSFLALGVALSAAILLWRAPWRRKWAIAAVAVLLLVAFFWLGYGPKRISGGMLTLAKRLDYWRAALDTAIQRPMLGWGPGTFGENYLRYVRAEEFAGGALPEEPRMAHNGFLQLAADSGVISLVAFALIWGAAIWGAAKLYRKSADANNRAMWLAAFAGLTGWTAHEMVDFDLYVPGVAAIAFVFAGLVLGAELKVRNLSGRPLLPDNKHRLPLTVVIPVTVFCVCVIVFLMRCSTANYFHVKARELVQEGNLSAAALAAIEATRRAPSNAVYQSFAADIQAAQAQWQAAEEGYERAAKLAPHQPHHHHRSAIARAKRLGKVDEVVLTRLRRAVELYPANPLYRKALDDALNK